MLPRFINRRPTFRTRLGTGIITVGETPHEVIFQSRSPILPLTINRNENPRSIVRVDLQLGLEDRTAFMADDLVPITALIEESESHLLALGERPQLISTEPRAEHLLPCALLE